MAGAEGREAIIEEVSKPLASKHYRTKSDVLSIAQEHVSAHVLTQSDSF